MLIACYYNTDSIFYIDYNCLSFHIGLHNADIIEHFFTFKIPAKNDIWIYSNIDRYRLKSIADIERILKNIFLLMPNCKPIFIAIDIFHCAFHRPEVPLLLVVWIFPGMPVQNI